ncbi:polyphosphate kinase 1 [Synechococcus elongatus FACHB-1061]|uniref:Polyphosphate kinase n=2 Tax=Synechococcus elongatus TaxID=32046 RepID=Q31MX3_SYNE7|nr:Polyphosphate kinase [Synechococcus elongatus PCC 7942 = FACHB-805]AJD57939.1 polyphosphate kinase [Synechococcus elongatus UTEX 2973]MBD2588402.1 polyphosphate kinase 1 [Synechococcus elongatus FACHB-242]MBD2689435.1 polyphosphate kinase 1 [Synechococcus elongatus FACHB-1061]MBD2708146.1 polyphosphate kinase 1 [Synechococcus elongatus PCC 7942 = FACHB-805]
MHPLLGSAADSVMRLAMTDAAIELNRPENFFNREISWLAFNQRVLHQALDPRTPLLERLKFMGIFSNNLDEYFMVRVASLLQQIEAGVSKRSPDGLTPAEQLEQIRACLGPLVEQQHSHFYRELRPLLAETGIHLLNYNDLNRTQQRYLDQYFAAQIFPVLTPLAVDPAHPFPHISNLSLNLAVLIQDDSVGEEQFARIKVPNILPRFIELPAKTRRRSQQPIVWMGVPIEQVIAHNLSTLFPGMSVIDWFVFRVTRDADLDVKEDEADDLLLAIEQELRKRRLGAGSVVRLEIEAGSPASILEILMNGMDLDPQDVYALPGLLSLEDLMSLTSLPLPELKDQPWTQVVPKRLRRVQMPVGEDLQRSKPSEESEDIFTVIRQRDLLMHHPYDSFAASVEQFVAQAATDPHVLAIKMTLYRTSGDSPIVQSLMQAAEHGKQVLALVELKARFDEENNITWARRLEKAGVHVVYGLVGLKIHTKVVLVVRQERNQIRRYVHIGTGNYNSKTARIYTDLGLLSCREDLGADISELFNYLTGFSKQRDYRKLLIAPVSLREQMIGLIDREIQHAIAGRPAAIRAKMNSLVDPKIILKLYEASQAGVEIDLIVRGVCCLRPGVPGLSDRIRVISIIGRFLEHSRIFSFHNNGQEEFFIGSADWMTRNLDRRVEAITPIEDEAIAAELRAILDISLADDRLAWDLLPSGEYQLRQPVDPETPHSSQQQFMNRAATTR